MNASATASLPRFIVLTARACMPNRCFGGNHYRRVAVVELDGTGVEPKMISARARGAARVVATWERRFEGTSFRCAYQRALDAAQDLCDRLNAAA